MPEYIPLPFNGVEPGQTKEKTVRGWPDEPKRLEPSYANTLWGNVGNILAILFSLFVMVYAGFVRHYDSVRLQDVPSYHSLREIANLGPSVFPIVFAAVVATNLRTISLWQLEKGQTIGVLDQLLGSTSVISTITTQFQSRAYGPVGLCLIALWIISPLGGQATLRILDSKQQVDNSSRPVNYPTMNYTDTFDPGYASDSYALSSKTTFFTAAIMSPASVKNSTVDLWGNVKVPLLSPFPTSDWFPVPPNPPYSSLIGLPLGNIPPLSTGSSMYVELPSTYWTVACVPLTTVPRFTALRNNDAWFGPPIDEFPGATSLLATGKAPGTRHRLLYESRTRNCTDGEPGCVLHAECSYAAAFVELGVNCTQDSFEVLRVRNASAGSARPDLVGQNLWLFAKFFTTAFNSPSAVSSLQYYLQDPNRPWSAGGNGTAPLDTGVPADVFALRLGQLMNSLWAALVMDYLLPVGRVPDLDAHTDQVGNKTAALGKRMATVKESYRALRCDVGWLVVVFVAALVVFAVSVAGVVLSFMTTVPELRMNASTMVRLSPWAGEMVAAGGTALGDGERGRLLKRVRVRLGDVRPDEMVGRIEVAAVGEGLPRTGRVRAGRLYE